MSKVRPVAVISLEEMNAALDTVVVCPLTTRLHPRWRSRVQVKCGGKPAEIAVDQIRAISRSRLLRRIDSLTSSAALQLRQLITEMYGE
jgi:mRNA interferase MazF